MSYVHSLISIKQAHGSNLRGLEDNKPIDRGKLKNVDGGYAWVIVFAAFFAHVLINGLSWTQGIFYMVFLEEFRESSTITAWIGTIITTCNFLGGPFGSILTNRFGKRQTTVFGCLVGSVGIFASGFATSVYHLYCTFAVAGFGLGITFIPMITVVGEYFDRLRNIAIGLSAAGVGFGTFIYPPLIRVLIQRYDWRDSLIIMSAINLNLIVVAALLRPVYDNFYDELELNALNFSNEDIRDDSDATDRSVKPRKRSMKDVLQWDVWQNISYVCLVPSNIAAFVGVSIVYLHVGNFAFLLSFSFSQCSMILGAIGIANLVGRVLFGFLGQHPNLNVIGLYTVSSIIVGFVTILCPFLQYYAGILTYGALFGFLTATQGVLLPEVLVLTVGLQRLSGGYGYVMIAQATGYLIGGPIGGIIFEAYGSYVGVFFLAGGLLLFSGIVMIVPWNRSRKPWDLSKLESDSNFHGYGVSGSSKNSSGASYP